MSSSLRSKASELYDSKLLLILILLIGVAARLAQYLYNRSLWNDEAALAIAVVTTPFSELWGPLIYNQAAPIGFLAAAKLLTELLGHTEPALRLIPLACGLASLILFLKAVKVVCNERVTPIALCLFACSRLMVDYSTEFKQYSSDVFFSLLLVLLISESNRRELTLARTLVLSSTGAAAIWFSHPALFILAGGGTAVAGAAILSREWKRLVRLALTGCVWIASLALNYYVSLETMSNNAEMKEYWSGYFAPFPPTDLSELRWLARQAARWFDESGVILGAVALVLLLLGAISIFKRDRVHFSILALPILLLLIASGLNIFPMTTRVILFILPLLYIFAAAGAEDARLASAPASTLPSVVLATALCLGPLCYASLRIVEPRLHEESRSAIELVKENWREGDTLYVFRGGRIAFHYYGRLRYHMEGDRVILGSGPKRNVAGFESDLEKLRSRGRVWFFFSNVRKMGTGEIDEEQFFLQRLESMGERLDGFLMRGASTYLYDLNESG